MRSSAILVPRRQTVVLVCGLYAHGEVLSLQTLHVEFGKFLVAALHHSLALAVSFPHDPGRFLDGHAGYNLLEHYDYPRHRVVPVVV